MGGPHNRRKAWNNDLFIKIMLTFCTSLAGVIFYDQRSSNRELKKEVQVLTERVNDIYVEQLSRTENVKFAGELKNGNGFIIKRLCETLEVKCGE